MFSSAGISFATSGSTVAMAAISISPVAGCTNVLSSMPSVWPSSYLACSTSSDILRRTAAVSPRCRASALQKREVITSARRQACINRDSLRFYSGLGGRGDVSGLSLGPIRGRGSQFLVAASEEEKSGSGIVSVEDGEESSLSGSVAVAASEEDITESVAVEDVQSSTTGSGDEKLGLQLRESNSDDDVSGLNSWLYPGKDELPDDKEMTIFDHLEELRDRILVSVAAVGVAIVGCFFFAKELIVLLEAPVYAQGVRFLQLSPGEYFFTTLKVAGYCGLLVGSPVILYEITAFVIPGLTRSEKKFLGPIVISSSVLFFAGIAFSYKVLTPAALNFFVSYSEGAVESLWSIDKYFEFVLVLLFSTGLSFQVPVIQLLLGQSRLVTAEQMLSAWRYVVVGAVIVAAVLTPSTDPLTQVLLAAPLIGLYMGGAFLVKFLVTDQEPIA